MSTLKLFFRAIKTTFTNVAALAAFAVIYALLLATFFKFIWTREATLWQVFLTYSLMALLIAEFFLLQSAIINRVRDQKFRWRVILIDALKFFVVAVPMVLVGWLLYYLLSKWGGRYPAPVAPVLPITAGPPKPAPIHWPSLIFSTLRFVLMGIAVPLATIHLWIAIAGGEVRALFAQGARPLLNRIGAAFARAFSSESILIYALGLIFFFLLPYAVLFVPFTPKGNKTDFAVFILRLLLTFLFTLIGWVVTVSALARIGGEPDPVPSAKANAVMPAEAAA